ncbi:hypothetical protein BBOV_III009100 [Babesia bovis T2Bo]|uniref:Plasmodium falciparum CPW-WPC domain containing protein n=1 Tax=Babesia bovis TaxID=5865 RepID=A7API3_BABBO|nr:hypothetical protein BBOV_III009100 [Babesia bovis T2Bo]EDO08467.1 hypothetical protein BBOV_III009100 [Babesia bovis T2Bo]|eukprot:XP_001612035.1 Plasmodium falciparum CPW-WPC domain containing protein [Babesia bovis T2Bo]
MRIYALAVGIAYVCCSTVNCVNNDPEPETPAEAITSDVKELSEQVDEVIESNEEDESSDDKDRETPVEEKPRKFERLYKNALNEAMEEGKEEYKKFERSAIEDLDIVEIASEHLKRYWYTGQCRRNYNRPCPNGWLLDNEASICVAPVDYQGPCEKRKDFSYMDEPARIQYAIRCHVSWPCVNDPPIDESATCPLEWTKLTGTVCIAPASYDGICPPIASFHGYSIKEKMEYERLCNLKWPRRISQSDLLVKSKRPHMGATQHPSSMSGAIDETGTMVPL